MFGGKKEKELEQELFALREKQNSLKKQIEDIAKGKDATEETLAQITISKEEIDEMLEAVAAESEHLKECSEANSGQTVLLKQQLTKKTKQNEELKKKETELFEIIGKERKAAAEILAQKNDFALPVKAVEDCFGALEQEQASSGELLNQMLEMSKKMSVLSLTAAMEASRMGEDGRKFLEAAEEIHVSAEQYTEALAQVLAHRNTFEDRINETRWQLQILNGLLEENHMSVKKYLEQYGPTETQDNREASAEETELLNIEEIIEHLCQGENEFFEVQSRLLSQISSLQEEWKEHKEYTDELERAVEEIHKTVQA